MGFVENKTCVITGATSQIGAQACRQLVRRGVAELGLVCRNESAGRKLVRSLRRLGKCEIDLVCSDFRDPCSLVNAGTRLRQRYPSLQLLIHAAGVVSETDSQATRDETLAVNLLAPIRLTETLLASMRLSPARIVLVASRSQPAQADPDYLRGARRLAGIEAYKQAKLALVAYGFELARRLESSGVTVNSLHPGIVDSRLLRAYEGPTSASAEMRVRNATPLDLLRLRRWASARMPGSWLSTPAQAASSIVRLADCLELGSVTGEFFDRDVPSHPHVAALDESFQADVRRFALEAFEPTSSRESQLGAAP